VHNSAKNNRLALVSFICGLIALLSLGLYWLLQALAFPSSSEVMGNRFILPIMDITVSVRNLCAITALVTGLIAINQIKKAGLKEKGRAFAWIGIVMGAGWILFGLLVGALFLFSEITY
jgi:hypothetical protein